MPFLMTFIKNKEAPTVWEGHKSSSFNLSPFAHGAQNYQCVEWNITVSININNQLIQTDINQDLSVLQSLA